MSPSVSRIDPALLDQALADIREHIADPKNWPAALKQLSRIRDYSFGDTRSCTAATALQNCEEIKSYFPASTPPSVPANIDAIAAEIRRLDREDSTLLLQFATNPLVLLTIGILVALYFYLFP